MSAVSWIVAAVAMQRVIELWHARRNTQRLRARGGVETGARHYPVIVAVHVAWLSAILIIVPAEQEIALPWLAAYGVLQVLRYWTVGALGPYWTTRVIVVPGAATVRTGPYRCLRHPNYAVVAGEIAVLPMVFEAWRLAVLFSVLNAVVLAHRIRIEERARRGNE